MIGWCSFLGGEVLSDSDAPGGRKGRPSISGTAAEGVFCFFILPAADDAHLGHP